VLRLLVTIQLCYSVSAFLIKFLRQDEFQFLQFAAAQLCC